MIEKRSSTVLPGDENLPAWHLPAEKRLGFADMFAKLCRQGLQAGMEPDEFRRLAMEKFGIPKRGLPKISRDAWKRAHRVLSQRVFSRSRG